MIKEITDTNIYKEIKLPRLPRIKENNYDKIRSRYNKIMEIANNYYFKNMYYKAKDEFLKVYDFIYKDNSYKISLIRVYRKIIKELLHENKYQDAIQIYNEMFLKCKNYTTNDLNTYNKVATILNKTIENNLELKELKTHDFDINNFSKSKITFIQELRKKSYTRHSNGISDIINKSISIISYDKKSISFNFTKKYNNINHSIYRYKKSNDGNHFIVSSRSLNIYVYD